MKDGLEDWQVKDLQDMISKPIGNVLKNHAKFETYEMNLSGSKSAESSSSKTSVIDVVGYCRWLAHALGAIRLFAKNYFNTT